MIRALFLSAALLFAAMPTVAGEGCEHCGNAKAKPEATASAWTKHIADLQAKADAGDKRAEAALSAGRKACKADCNTSMAAKIAKLEEKATAGDAEAKKSLESMRWTMVFASVRAAPLSEQATFYAKACDHGCEISKQSLAVMMKETGAKDQEQLLATVSDWEAKAAKGCPDCTKKIASLKAKLEPSEAPAKVSLSEQVGKLAAVAAKGDETAKDQLAKIAASIEVKPEQVAATLKELEAKAANGCGASKAKLAKVSKVLAKDCGDCDDCEGCGDCDKECEGTCPVESKPVQQ